MIFSKPNIFVFGASGHAKVVIDVIEKQGLYHVAFIIDDNKALHGKQMHHYEIIGDMKQLLASNEVSSLNGIVAIGNNGIRVKISQMLIEVGVKLKTVIHPAANIGFGFKGGSGSVVMAGCVINPDVWLGDGVIINTSTSVDHDCVIGDYVHVAPGCHLCGNVTVGDGSFIGAGTTIIPGIKVGVNVLVGAGSTITHDVPDNARVVGSPGRPIKIKTQ